MARDNASFEAEYDFCLESVKGNLADLTSEMLNAVDRDGIALICLGNRLMKPREEIAFGIRAVAEAIVCRFAVMTGVERGLKVCDKPVILDKRPGQLVVGSQIWLTGFWLNLLRRDQRALSFLSLISIDAMRASTTVSSEYSYRMVQILQALVAEDPRTGDLLMSAMDATDPDRFELVDAEYALSISVHILNVLGCALADDAKALTQSLEDGLEAFEEYWTQDDNRRREPSGFLALGLLGAAAYAYDRGLRFNIDSPLLPMWMLTGEGLKA